MHLAYPCFSRSPVVSLESALEVSQTHPLNFCSHYYPERSRLVPRSSFRKALLFLCCVLLIQLKIWISKRLPTTTMRCNTRSGGWARWSSRRSGTGALRFPGKISNGNCLINDARGMIIWSCFPFWEMATAIFRVQFIGSLYSVMEFGTFYWKHPDNRDDIREKILYDVATGVDQTRRTKMIQEVSYKNPRFQYYLYLCRTKIEGGSHCLSKGTI